jgi:hypothetical protein
MTVNEPSADDLTRIIASARAHEETQRDLARTLESTLATLNELLGEVRLRQERMQRPSTLFTEAARERLDRWLARLRIGRSRA